jgi:competence protein ComEC
MALGAWAAAAGATFLSPRRSFVVTVGAIVVAWLLRRRWVVCTILAGAAAGASSSAVHIHALRSGPVPALARHHAEVDVVARLVRDPVSRRSLNGARLTLIDATVTSVRQARWRRTNSPVLVLSYSGGWDGLLPGQRVAVAGRLMPPRPGDDVAAVLEARAPPIRYGQPLWWQRAAGRVRTRLRAAVGGLPPDPRGLLPSLVEGDTSGVPAGLQTDMRITGLTHLEAVSGENVTVVIGVVLALARAIGVRRRGRVTLCAVALLCFVVLARPSPSVLRAAVMGSVALVAMLAGRRSSALPALSVAVVTLVVLDPFLARAVGFVLSVVATAALVLVAPGWTARLQRWMPSWLAVAIAVPAAAQCACTPVLILVFGQLTPYAIPANLLAAPAVVPATVLGVTAAVVASVSVPAATPVAWLGVVPTAGIAVVARSLAAMPGAALRWNSGAAAVVLVGVLVAISRWILTARAHLPGEVVRP